MTEDDSSEIEELRRAEVERAVAPYADVAPPFVLRKLRELSDRYWRENPVAVQALRLMSRKPRVRSGTEPVALADAPRLDADGTEEG